VGGCVLLNETARICGSSQLLAGSDFGGLVISVWRMEMAEWSELIWSGTIAGLACVTATVMAAVLAGVVLVKMPATYFCDQCRRDLWADRNPVLRWIGRAFKNVLGASLVVLGGALSIPGVPGPGLLLILFGITLLDLPGKRRLERWFVGRPAVLNTINGLRRRYGKPPIELEST
jgi:hypothetical protein